MTSNNIFLTDTQASGLFCLAGFIFIIAGGFFAKQVQLVWMGIGISLIFFLCALYFIMRGYNKEYDQIKRM